MWTHYPDLWRPMCRDRAQPPHSGGNSAIVGGCVRKRS
jgi:hypothetical protein